MTRALIEQMLDCITTLRHTSNSLIGNKQAAQSITAAREYLAAPEQSEPLECHCTEYEFCEPCYNKRKAHQAMTTTTEIMALADAYAQETKDFGHLDNSTCRSALLTAIESLVRDAERIKFLDSNKSMTLDWNRKRKWAYRATFTSYEFDCFNTVREAIDAAMLEKSPAIAAHEDAREKEAVARHWGTK